MTDADVAWMTAWFWRRNINARNNIEDILLDSLIWQEKRDAADRDQLDIGEPT
jgi:hypothetical protein